MRSAGIAVCIALASCGPPAGGQGPDEAGGPPAGFDASKLPDFTLDKHDGSGSVNLHSLAGKNVIAMSFWATWCDACQIELPQIESLYQKYRADGFIALAITMDTAETVGEVPAAVQRMGLTFPVLLDTESQVAGVYNPRNAAPLFILIDRSGTQIYTHEGFVVADVAEMESRIREALGKE